MSDHEKLATLYESLTSKKTLLSEEFGWENNKSTSLYQPDLSNILTAAADDDYDEFLLNYLSLLPEERTVVRRMAHRIMQEMDRLLNAPVRDD